MSISGRTESELEKMCFLCVWGVTTEVFCGDSDVGKRLGVSVSGFGSIVADVCVVGVCFVGGVVFDVCVVVCVCIVGGVVEVRAVNGSLMRTTEKLFCVFFVLWSQQAPFIER